jgi:hypothetical protein
MSKYNKMTVAAALVAATMFGGPAFAAPPVIVDLNNCAVTDTDPTADACDGYFDNLNTDGNADEQAFLQGVLDQWNLDIEDQIKDNDADGGSTNSLFDAYVTGGNDGAIKFLQALSGPFAIAIKAGNYLGLYFFADDTFNIDDLLTFTIPEMGGDGLSHVSIFGGDGHEVPEPGTLALLGLGLAGLGLRRRLKK